MIIALVKEEIKARINLGSESSFRIEKAASGEREKEQARLEFWALESNIWLRLPPLARQS